MKRRKIRRDFKYARIVALLLVIILSYFGIRYFLHGEDFEKNSASASLANYKNSFSYDYEIDTKENEFVDYTEDKEYSAYITNLIKNVEMTYNYKFENTNKKKSKIKYRYSVDGKLLGFYSKDGEEQKIIEKDYSILEQTERSSSDGNFTINETFDINVKPLNKLISNFKVKEDIPVSSRYDVILNIEIEGLTDKTIKYSPKVSIEIGNKTTKISGDNNFEDSKATVDAKKAFNENKEKYAFLLGVVILYAICRIVYLLFFTEEVLVIKNKYKGQINDILRSYQDRIVVINDMPVLNNKAIIKVENIDEIAKLSEELYKPILCYENDEETMTQFIIISDESAYVYKVNKN